MQLWEVEYNLNSARFWVGKDTILTERGNQFGFHYTPKTGTNRNRTTDDNNKTKCISLNYIMIQKFQKSKHIPSTVCICPSNILTIIMIILYYHLTLSSR